MIVDQNAHRGSEMARGKYSPERATEFAAKLAATGLPLAEFARRIGISRGAIYHLSRGQAPSSDEKAEKLTAAFEQFKK